MAERTFGWVQNPGDLKKLKKVVSVFLYGSSENQWLITQRLPLLKKYDLISGDDYNAFISELSKSTIEVKYAILKGKGAGKLGRRKAKMHWNNSSSNRRSAKQRLYGFKWKYYNNKKALY